MSGIIETALSSNPLSLQAAEKLFCQLIFHNEKENIEYYPIQLVNTEDSGKTSAVLVFQAAEDVCQNLIAITGDSVSNIVSEIEIDEMADKKEDKPTLKKVNRFKEPEFGKKKAKAEPEWMKKKKGNKVQQVEEKLKQNKQIAEAKAKTGGNEEKNAEVSTIDTTQNNNADNTIVVQEDKEKEIQVKESSDAIVDGGDNDKGQVNEEISKKDVDQSKAAADAGKEKQGNADQGKVDEKKPALKKVNRFKEPEFGKKKAKPELDWMKKKKGNKVQKVEEKLKQNKQKIETKETNADVNQDETAESESADTADPLNEKNVGKGEEEEKEAQKDAENIEEEYGDEGSSKMTDEEKEKEEKKRRKSSHFDELEEQGNVATPIGSDGDNDNDENNETKENMASTENEDIDGTLDRNHDDNIFLDDKNAEGKDTDVKGGSGSGNDTENAGEDGINTEASTNEDTANNANDEPATMYMTSIKEEHEVSVSSNELTDLTHSEAGVEKDAFVRNVEDAYEELFGQYFEVPSIDKLHDMGERYGEMFKELEEFDGSLSDAGRDYINKGKTFHARKARRHRIRRWQDDMKGSGLMDVIDAMRSKTRHIQERQERLLKFYSIN